MDDEQIRARIEELEEEERRLRSDERDAAEHEARDRLAADVQRLAAVRVELDRLWDYLRQRAGGARRRGRPGRRRDARRRHGRALPRLIAAGQAFASSRSVASMTPARFLCARS